MALADHATTFTKSFKLVLNIIVLVLYRNGDEGYFMGASHNMNHDSEAFATGVFIGFLIYNCVSLVTIFINRGSANSNITETLMNLVGFLLWIIVGGLTMQYWIEFLPSNHYTNSGNPKPAGIAMGALSVVNSMIYLAETFLTYRSYNNNVNYHQ